MNKSTFIEKFARGETAWLHGHEIVKVDSGLISLDPCGWYTQTTKSYMNLALQSLNSPYRVVQKAGDWYIKPTNSDVKPQKFSGSLTIKL